MVKKLRGGGRGVRFGHKDPCAEIPLCIAPKAPWLGALLVDLGLGEQHVFSTLAAKFNFSLIVKGSWRLKVVMKERFDLG